MSKKVGIRPQTGDRAIVFKTMILIILDIPIWNPCLWTDLCIFLISFPGGLEISLHPTSQPTEKHNVSLQCVADKFSFEDLAWYKFSPRASVTTRLGRLSMSICKNLEELEKLNVTSTRVNGENITVELLLRNISLQDSGDYVCMARDKKIKTRSCLVKHLTIQGKPMLNAN